MSKRRIGPGSVVWCVSLAIAVTTATATAQSQEQTAFECLIKPDLLVKLGSPVDGILGEVNFDRGDKVKKGEIVARLEDRVEEASLALAKERALSTAKINLSRARLEFQMRKQGRAQQLHGKKFLSDAKQDEAETDATLAQLQLNEEEFNKRIAALEYERAKAILDRRSVHSPFGGVVVERMLSPGEYVYEQAQILSIAKLDPLNVEMFVPVGLYGTIEVGDTAQVRPEEPIGGVFAAKVTVVDQVLDAASSTFGVRLELPNPDYKLPAGLRCKVTFPAIN